MPLRPRVTVGVASYNCSAFLTEALDCILNQTVTALEVIVVDDASTDKSVEVAQAVARRDSRVRVDVLPRNGGPGAARNRVLELARGDWYAVVDSDDLIHPRRLEALLAAAERGKLDIVADNLLLFSSGPQAFVHPHFVGARARKPVDLTVESYLAETLILVSPAHLGFIKPVIRLSALRATGLTYNAAMRIGEDDDLLVRLLASGLKGRTFPHLTYFYRKHSASVSHTLSDSAMARIVEQERLFRADLGAASAGLRRALDRRRRTNEDADGFVKLVAALKARGAGAALAAIARRPSSVRLLSLPIKSKVNRAIARVAAIISPTPQFSPSSICIISRRASFTELVHKGPGLLALASGMKASGISPHLLVAPGQTQAAPVVERVGPLARNFASVRRRATLIWGSMAICVPGLGMSRASAAESGLGERDDAAIFWARHSIPRGRLATIFDGFDAAKAASPYLLGAGGVRLIALDKVPGPRDAERHIDLIGASGVKAILAFDEVSAAWAAKHASSLFCIRMTHVDDGEALVTWLRDPRSWVPALRSVDGIDGLATRSPG